MRLFGLTPTPTLALPLSGGEKALGSTPDSSSPCKGEDRWGSSGEERAS